MEKTNTKVQDVAQEVKGGFMLDKTPVYGKVTIDAQDSYAHIKEVIASCPMSLDVDLAGLKKNILIHFYDMVMNIVNGSVYSKLTFYKFRYNQSKEVAEVKLDPLDISEDCFVTDTRVYSLVLMLNYYRTLDYSDNIEELAETEMLTSSQKKLLDYVKTAKNYLFAMKDLLSELVLKYTENGVETQSTLLDWAKKDRFSHAIIGWITGEFLSKLDKDTCKLIAQAIENSEESHTSDNRTLKGMEISDTDMRNKLSLAFKFWQPVESPYTREVSGNIKNGGMRKVISIVTHQYYQGTKKDKDGREKLAKDVDLKLVQKELAIQMRKFIQAKCAKKIAEELNGKGVK